MKEKKLFVVSIEIESVVLAEDKDDACYVASQNRQDIMEETDMYSAVSWSARPCKRLPHNWDENSLPWASLDEEAEELPCKHYLNKE